MTSWNVRLVPGEHEFTVEGEETLLEAALRAGISVGYSCSNGNCGDCRARVISGGVRPVRPQDYVFSEQYKQQGYTLMCTVTPTSDLVLETGVAEGPAQIPLQEITASVRGTDRPDPHVLILRVQTPRSRRLRFLAGQHVRLSTADGSHSATLPLANCPCDDRNLVFHLAADTQDPFARHFLEDAHTGEAIHLEGPHGDFVLPDETPRPLMFIAGNTGFAPVRSLVEHVLAQETAEEVDLIWAADGNSGHYQDNLCRAWQDAIDNFHYRAMDWDAASSESSNPGRTLAETLAGIADPGGRRCFIAGPADFVRSAREAVLAWGVSPDALHVQAIPPQS
jgi:CDP-4-dehydro-6-deoxyglucose reductase, E3